LKNPLLKKVEQKRGLTGASLRDPRGEQNFGSTFGKGGFPKVGGELFFFKI